MGYGLEGALKFGFYETFKGLFKSLTPSQFVNFLMASVVAGGVASVVLVRGSVIYNVFNNVQKSICCLLPLKGHTSRFIMSSTLDLTAA